MNTICPNKYTSPRQNVTRLTPPKPGDIMSEIEKNAEKCENLDITGKKRVWNKEKCANIALLYKSKTAFMKANKSAYNFSVKNGFLGEICSHMKKRIPANWTFEECRVEALKYEYKNDFARESPSHYYKSRREKWINLICSHMRIVGNLFKRMVYAYEFEDKSVYVGLTYNEYERDEKHKRPSSKRTKSPVYDYKNKTGLNYIYKKISDYIYALDASDLEIRTVEEYRGLGWKILNKAKPGGLGGVRNRDRIIIWTKEACFAEALKYETRSEFRNNAPTACSKCCDNDWMNDACSHMKVLKKPDGYWTLERCKEEALRFKTRQDFKKKSHVAYVTTCENGWTLEVCKHFIILDKPDGYWRNNKENCRKEALKYTSRGDFALYSESAYKESRINGWLDEICSHMISKHYPAGYWTKEKCFEEAKKHNNITEFARNFSFGYEIVRQNGWNKELIAVMKESK